MSNDESAIERIENRLANARPVDHGVPASRLDEMIARGTNELPRTDRPGIDAHRSEPSRHADQREVELEVPASNPRHRTLLRPAVVTSLAAAAAIVVAVLVVDRDSAPAPVDVAGGQTAPSETTSLASTTTPATASPAIAWLGVAGDERTPERPLIGGYRLQMDAEEIRLIWASAENDDDPTGIVYDLRRVTVEPGEPWTSFATADAFAGGERRYLGSGTAFLDTDLEPGAEYVYGVVATVDGVAGDPTWRSDVFAITDQTAPAPATDLVLDADGALSWDHPSVEEVTTFAVLARTGDDYTRIDTIYPGQMVSSIGQLEPAPDEIVIVAIDVHGNASEAASIAFPG